MVNGSKPEQRSITLLEVPSEDRSTRVYPFVILSIRTDITLTLTHTFLSS